MSFKTINANYNLIGGDHNFDPVQVDGENIIVAVDFTNLSNNTATVELHQSVDKIIWGVVPDSNKALIAGQTSHAWNVIGLVTGAYLRVSLKPNTCTGIVNNIKVLSNE